MSSIHKLFPGLTRGIVSMMCAIAIGALAGCHVHHRATTAPVALRSPTTAEATSIPAATEPAETASVLPAEVPSTAVAPTTTSVAIPIGAIGGYRQFPPMTCYYQNGDVMAHPTYELTKPMPPKVTTGYSQEMLETAWRPILFNANILVFPLYLVADPFWNLHPYTGFERDRKGGAYSPDFPTRPANALANANAPASANGQTAGPPTVSGAGSAAGTGNGSAAGSSSGWGAGAGGK